MVNVTSLAFKCLAGKSLPMENELAQELNRFSDREFLDMLSDNDHAAMTALVEDFFCSSLQEQEEQGYILLYQKKHVLRSVCYN